MQACPSFVSWLEQNFHQPINLKRLPGDASKRLYFRVFNPDKQVIAVDASQEPEMNRKFVTVTELLHQHAVNVPKIITADHNKHYLLLTDFGDNLYQYALTQENASTLYLNALEALLTIQSIQSETLPKYSAQLLQDEMLLFEEWYLNRFLGIELDTAEQKIWQNLMLQMVDSAISQPQVCVHRDYHSRNLFLLNNNSPGIIDHQDAVLGPITYDPVSLLKDCYIKWPRRTILNWLKTYYINATQSQLLNGIAEDQFHQWFDWMGIQRHLKAIGIFARLWVRDQKEDYLAEIPRTLGYIHQTCQLYPSLQSFQAILENRILNKDSSMKH